MGVKSSVMVSPLMSVAMRSCMLSLLFALNKNVVKLINRQMIVDDFFMLFCFKVYVAKIVNFCEVVKSFW